MIRHFRMIVSRCRVGNLIPKLPEHNILRANIYSRIRKVAPRRASNSKRAERARRYASAGARVLRFARRFSIVPKEFVAQLDRRSHSPVIRVRQDIQERTDLTIP